MAKKKQAKAVEGNAPVGMDEYYPKGDARTLADSEAIRAHPQRHAAAISAAQDMHGEKMIEAKAMRKVAMGKPKKVDDRVRQMPFKK